MGPDLAEGACEENKVRRSEKPREMTTKAHQAADVESRNEIRQAKGKNVKEECRMKKKKSCMPLQSQSCHLRVTSFQIRKQMLR